MTEQQTSEDTYLRDKYDFTCAACGKALSARPSLSMQCGINSGGGRCPDCKASLHLEIHPDLHGDHMVSELFDTWFARVYPEAEEATKSEAPL